MPEAIAELEEDKLSQKLVIWGAGGHAKVVADIVRLVGNYEIVGFLHDLDRSGKMREFCGCRILGGREHLDVLYEAGVRNLIFGFGSCEARLRYTDFVFTKGFCLAKALHPQATIASDVLIGDGTVVVAGAVVNPGTIVGTNVIINTASSIDHDCFVGDGVHVAPGAHLAGGVNVGRGTWIGIGSVVKERISIGSNTVVGAGSVVLNDIPDGVIAYGSPARIVRSNNSAQSG